MSEGALVVDRRGEVLILRLNRPEARNALTPGLVGDLGAAFAAAEDDPATRVVILTGTGDRAFCAGMDLRSFSEGEAMPSIDDPRMQAFQRFARGELGVPMIGAANATAVAGGFELLLGCDLIVLADGATVGLPEVKRGLFAAGGGTFLGGRIPLSVALEITLTGDPIDAARALALGLVNAVVPSGEVLDVALAYAERIAANGPLSVRATKELVRLGMVDPARAWKRLEEWQPKIFGSDDAREGALAFIEKRPPVWKGQ